MSGNRFQPLGNDDIDMIDLTLDANDDVQMPEAAPPTQPGVDDHWLEPGDFFYDLKTILEVMCRPRRLPAVDGLDWKESYWKFDDHSARTGQEVAGYALPVDEEGPLVVPSLPDRESLFLFLLQYRSPIEEADAVYFYVDNRPPGHADMRWFRSFASWMKERCRWTGPYQEKTTALYFQVTEDTGLQQTHYVWAGVFFLEALTFLFPQVNFALIDTDCVPLSLFEVGELACLVASQNLQGVKPEDCRTEFNVEVRSDLVDPPPAVILVSEFRAEINAGLVIVTRSSSRGWGDGVSIEPLLQKFHAVRKQVLDTSRPDDSADRSMTLRTGLAGSPLGGVSVQHPFEFPMIWALLGEFAGSTVWPLPNGPWPRSAHPRLLTDDAKTRRPSFLSWARPPFEQAVLPSLSLLQSKITTAVVPGDGVFNSRFLPKGFMRPAIVHAYGNIKSRVSSALRTLAAEGMVPMLVSFLGTDQLPPAWQASRGWDIAPGARLFSRRPHGIIKENTRTRYCLSALWIREDHPFGRSANLAWEQKDFSVDFEVHSTNIDVGALPSLAPRTAARVLGSNQAAWTSALNDRDGAALRSFRRLVQKELLADLGWAEELRSLATSRLYCTGLGGQHAPFQCSSDFQLECSRDTLTYGGSMVGQDQWDQKKTHFGVTPASHEYASFLMFGVKDAVMVWQHLLPKEQYGYLGNPILLRQRMRDVVSEAAPIPAHRHAPHPTFKRGIEFLLLFLRPDSVRVMLRRCYAIPPELQVKGYFPVPRSAQLDIFGFSAGSYNGLAVDLLIHEGKFPLTGLTRVGAIACHPSMLPHSREDTLTRSYHLVHVSEDSLCDWWPSAEVLKAMQTKGIRVSYLEGKHADSPWLGRANHSYGHLLEAPIPDGIQHLTDLEKICPESIPEEFFHSTLLRVLTWCTVKVDPALANLLQSLDVCTQDPGGDLVGTACTVDSALVTEELIFARLLEGVSVVFDKAAIDDATPVLRKFLRPLSLPLLVYVLNYYLPQVVASDDWSDEKLGRVCVDAQFLTSRSDCFGVSIELVRLGAAGLHTFKIRPLLAYQQYHLLGFGPRRVDTDFATFADKVEHAGDCRCPEIGLPLLWYAEWMDAPTSANMWSGSPCCLASRCVSPTTPRRSPCLRQH